MTLYEISIRTLVLFYFAWAAVDLANYVYNTLLKRSGMLKGVTYLEIEQKWYNFLNNKPFNCHVCMVFWLSWIYFIPLPIAGYMAVVGLAALLGGLMMKLRTLVI